MPMLLNPGDRITLKKQHPCGSREFDIIRTGADFRIKCVGCGHEIWISRSNLERRIRKVVPAVENQE